ncbi:MAG: phasin family protein [Methylocystis sp.]
MIAPDDALVSTSMKTYQDYATRLLDFGLINMQSSLQFAQEVWTAKTPDDLAKAMVDYGRRQFECWSEEFEELSATTGGQTKENGERAGLGD